MNKNIGIYLRSNRAFGGTFQYSKTLLNALDEILYKNQDHLVIFLLNSESEFSSIKTLSESSVILLKKSFIEKKIFPLIKFILPHNLLKFVSRFSKFYNSTYVRNCDKIFFPAQDFDASLFNTNAVTSILDLMHIYEPNFKEYNFIEKFRRNNLYKNLSSGSHTLIVDSIVGANQLEESFPISRKKYIIILPYMPDWELLNKIPSANNYDKFIFYPAQFWEHKNHKNLILAFKNIHDKFPDIKLLLVGKKLNLYSHLSKLVNLLQLENSILFLDYVSDEILVGLYKSAICMVYPSFCGPTNIPPLESIMLGCPLICSNKYAMPEQLNDAALFFDPNNIVELTNKIEMLLSNDSLRNNLIKLGFERANKFSKYSFIKILNSIIE